MGKEKDQVVIRGTLEEIYKHIQNHLDCPEKMLSYEECTEYVDNHQCHLCIFKNETRFKFEVLSN